MKMGARNLTWVYAAAEGTAEAALTAFCPWKRGGDGAWRRFGFAGDPATLSGRVDVLAPARRAVEGLSTAVVRANAPDEIGESVHLTAASCAASLEALAQAMRAAQEVPLGAP